MSRPVHEGPATSLEPATQGLRGGSVFAFTWALAALIGVIWALATPIGASPDEPAHLVKAASVVRGEIIGEPSHQGHIVHVPRYVAAAHGVGCIVFQPEVPADCIDAEPADPSALVETTTTAGLYNPLYYLLVGWPSLLFGDVAGIYAMRIVSAVITALFLALSAAFALRLGMRGVTAASLGVAATPTLLFLTGAVNPNALEVTTTLATFVAMVAVVRRTDGAPLGPPLAVAAVSAMVGVQMRGLSPLWIAVALAAPLLLLSWSGIRTLLSRRAAQLAIVAIVVATLLAAVWTFTSNSLTGALDDDEHFQQYPGVGTSAATGFVVMLLDTFNHGTQMVASFGWLDTPAPQAVYFAWSAFIGTVALLAIGLLRGPRLRFALALALALVLLPPLAQAAYVTAGGYIWQGRYTLPLFAIAIVGAAIVVGERTRERALTFPETLRPDGRGLARVLATVWIVWAAAQAYSFVIALKRNAAGSDATWGQVLNSPDWSAPGGNASLIAIFVALVAVTATVAWWATGRRATQMR